MLDAVPEPFYIRNRQPSHESQTAIWLFLFMPMNCIVTAGPTIEPLDEVRRLTNFSTGKLGTELAAYLHRLGHKVTLLRSRTAVFNQVPPGVSLQIFSTTSDLFHLLHEHSAKSEDIQMVFHAAAVCDFKFGDLYRKDASGNLVAVNQDGKIPTHTGPLFAALLPTPKILNQLRTLFPSARIIGWKYEVDGSRQDAMTKGIRQMTEAQTDACVVNGPAYGKGFSLLLKEKESDSKTPTLHAEDHSKLFLLLSNWIQGEKMNSEL